MALVDKDREVLQKLADKSPQGFAWAKSFIEARAKTPGLELGSFLEKNNIPPTDYIRELQKSGRAAGDVLQAMQHEPGLTNSLASKMNIGVERAPTMPKATTAGEKGIAAFAEKEPGMFNAAVSYLDGLKNKTTAELESFLAKQGIKPANFIAAVETATGMSSGNLLNAMRKAEGFVEGVAKVVSHTKIGKAGAAAVTLGGAIMGSANASTLPQAGKEFAKAAAGAVDPTALVGPSILENSVAHAFGENGEFDKQGIDTRKIGVQKNAIAIANFNSRIDREEKFLMSADHPGQLGSLKFKDKNGKDVDVEKALKDPAQRATVMAEIDRRGATAETSEMKQLYTEMKEAAQSFAAVEDRRKPMPPDIVTAQKAQPQAAAPAMAG